MGGDPEGIDLKSGMPWSHLAEVVGTHAAAHGAPPFVVGIGGPVSVGKSTIAAQLFAALGGSATAGPVEVLGTDGFLFPNHELAVLGLELKKGFPESYDAPLLERSLDSLRAGSDVSVPVYSHETYDIVPGASRVILPPGVLILEGVNALQFHARLDFGVYVDAPVAAIETWYVDRLVALVADAPAGTFYAGWSAFTPEQVDALAHDIWRSINAVNLAEHIEPTRAVADVVVEKGPDHELLALRVQGAS
ncbi:MAG: type I pantothenate kinase [Acidimicrobiia bacterium]